VTEPALYCVIRDREAHWWQGGDHDAGARGNIAGIALPENLTLIAANCICVASDVDVVEAGFMRERLPYPYP